MVRRVSKIERRRRLLGWLKYLPALAIFFSAIFMEALLSKQMRQQDYEEGRLNTRMRELEQELETVMADASAFQNVDMLEERSILLGMVDSGPEQVVRIVVDGIEIPEPVMHEEVLAQVEPVQTPDLQEVLGQNIANASIAATQAPQVQYQLPEPELLEPVQATQPQPSHWIEADATPTVNLDEEANALLESL
jgi:cell division protein FtsB